jgi:hypothetical protein
MKISSSLKARKVRPNAEPVSLFRKKNMRAAKNKVRRRNDHLLSIPMPNSLMLGMPGMPKGPLVSDIQLFIREKTTTWMPRVHIMK